MFVVDFYKDIYYVEFFIYIIFIVFVFYESICFFFSFFKVVLWELGDIEYYNVIFIIKFKIEYCLEERIFKLKNLIRSWNL